MAADLKHTLLNLEATPPPGVWNAIAARLDTEFDAAATQLSEKLSEYELAPPASAWQNIETAIAEETEEEKAATVITLRRPFRQWAAAAAAVIVLALGGWYVMNRNVAPADSLSVVPVPAGNDNKAVPQNNEAATKAASDAVAETTRPLPRRPVTIVAAAQRITPKEDSTNNLPELSPELMANLQPAGLKNVQSLNSKDIPLVEAPPIRDANGNIILDKELLFSPDNNYIVVTGPNGEQTRISSKFLPLLSSMNSNMESLDYFQFFLNENNIWKLRFNEWRDRMLKQANFIPTATNLLDILELKEFLQEN